MKTIKYIVSCIVGILDAWVGKGTDNGVKEVVVGFGAMLIVIISFFVSLRFFDNRTNYSSVTNILCSIGVTILLICITIATIVVIEKCFF